jgi:hypothetical protein
MASGDDNSSFVQFRASTFYCTERHETAELFLMRAGSLDGEVSVDYDLRGDKNVSDQRSGVVG